MKVLQIIDTLRPGGAERMAVTYANALSRVGVNSFLCATRAQGSLKKTIDANVTCIHLSKRRSIDVKSIRECLRFIEKHHIQIIHAHGTSFFFATQLKILKPSLKLVWHNHYGAIAFQAKAKQSLIKVLSKRFDAIISVNESINKWAQTYLKHKEAYYIENFIETSRKIEKRIPLEGIEEKRIVCLANLKDPKGHHFLIKSFNTVLEKHPEATLHLVGTDYNDEYSIGIKEFIETNELHTTIFIHGAQHNPSAYLERCSIGVLSSSSEGLPMALLEYANANLAVVVTDVGQCRKVVQQYGEVISYGDEEAFSKTLITYLDHKEESVKKAALFKNHILKNYSETAVIPQVLTLYESMLNRITN